LVMPFLVIVVMAAIRPSNAAIERVSYGVA